MKYRKGNYIFDEDGDIATILIIDNETNYIPIELTKELCIRLGFEILDMGDFWEIRKGDFELIQLKVPVTGKSLTPSFVIYSKESKHVKVPYVHKLQNLYYEIEEEELILT